MVSWLGFTFNAKNGENLTFSKNKSCKNFSKDFEMWVKAMGRS